MKLLRIAIASDLHYRIHQPGKEPRPETADSGEAGDPMYGLLRMLEKHSSSDTPLRADYLLCPGDVTNQASPEGFRQGWSQLLKLKDALGAQQLIASTGNHEVASRTSDSDNTIGNSERIIDPLSIVQQFEDYPATCLTDDQRWIYWGRGFQIIEQPEVVFLVINSSHFHHTTRANEFERGRVSEVALDMLRRDIKDYVDRDRSKAFVALMHHHPIPHQDLEIPNENRIDMVNGTQLMQILEGTDVSWFVVHGHKHHGRLIFSQGGIASPAVFAAGSFGAKLTGAIAMHTALQFYIAELELFDQGISPKASVNIRAWHWTNSGWELSTQNRHGLPNRCGYSVPLFDQQVAVAKLKVELEASVSSYWSWDEAINHVPELGHIMPSDTRVLRRIFLAKGIKSTWADGDWFPSEVAK